MITSSQGFTYRLKQLLVRTGGFFIQDSLVGFVASLGRDCQVYKNRSKDPFEIRPETGQ